MYVKSLEAALSIFFLNNFSPLEAKIFNIVNQVILPNGMNKNDT